MTASPSPSRLAFLLVPTVLLAIAGAGSTLLAFGLFRPWLAPIWLLFLVSYGRMALSAVSPLLGLLPARNPNHGIVPRIGPGNAGRTRTALLLPMFNEPPEPIAAALRVMAEALDPADAVTIFVLSDTQDAVGLAREARFFPSSGLSRSGVETHYRHRSPNIGRKAGNIAAFCTEHGHDYDYAIILDADSLMTGQAIRDLIMALREDPSAAVIQSVSYPIGGTTLFARLQQFGARLGTPLSVAGQDQWQGRHGSYWGHNAILRLQPFMTHATLPVLPGYPPMGGEILCHDTIEAALLLRAGWDVRLATEIGGSFETTPSNLVDHLARERRWCQGNLQHLCLVHRAGFLAASRVHIAMGILYYLATPLGLLVSLLLLGEGLVSAAGNGAAIRPHWAIETCLWLTVFLLFAPRIASVAGTLLRPGHARRSYGGGLRLLVSVALEQLAGMLYAPIIVLSVSGFVIDTFCGRVVSWNTQPRGDRPVEWIEAVQRFGLHTTIGTAVTAAIALARPSLLPWTMPFLSGLLLSIPLAVWSGSVRLGLLARRLGLFLTVDELAPLPEQLAVSPQVIVKVPDNLPHLTPQGGMTTAGGD